MGEQIVEHFLFSTFSEDFIKALLSAVNACEFGKFKFAFVNLYNNIPSLSGTCVRVTYED
jgi:hypothetical protein